MSAYWFATNALWGALLVIMLPAEAKAIAPTFRVTALGLLNGLAALVALFVPLIIGALSDRCTSPLGRRRPYMIAGLGINLIGLGLMAWAFSARQTLVGSVTTSNLLSSSSFLFFLAAYMVVQFGNNVATAAYSGIIPDLVPRNQRGRASGYMALMSQTGTLFGGLVCGFLIRTHGEATAQQITRVEVLRYAALGTILLGVALITILGTKEGQLKTKPPKIQWGSYLKSLWISPREYPDFAWVWITRALVMIGFYSVLPFINYYFIDVIHVPSDQVDMTATMLMAVILITSSVSGVYGGSLSDRIGRKKVVYIANAMIAVISVSFIFCRTVPHAMLAGCIFGLGFGAYTSVDWALGTDVLPTKDNAAKEMAVWHIAMTLPQSIAAPIAGGLIESFGKTVEQTKDGPLAHYTVPGYSAVFVLCSVCFGLGAYLLKNVRKAR